MNAIVPSDFGAVSKKFLTASMQNDLSAGVQTGFAIVGYKGKVWDLRYRGESTRLMRADGDGPINSIEVVILKASSAISKIWYKDGYVEGSNSAPDCFSTNGVTPDQQSKNRQANTCAACPMNAWGSRITPQGKAGKACSDSKRIVIVPLQDLRNEVYGGPMLLRIPAASLNELAQFGNKLASLGYPYNSVGVRIGFDPAEAFPKFKFSAIRPLTDEEAGAVLELQADPQIGRILAEGSEHAQAPAPAAPTVDSVFEQPPVAAPAPVAAPVTPEVKAEAPKRDYKKKPAPAPVAAAPEPVVDENAATGSSFDDELDAQLNGLLGN
jgi:hypothetical protein